MPASCENLDLGRLEEIKLIFQRRMRRRTRARFCTRVVTREVTPSLNVYYKNARIKQYHKENRALRTETTINNTYDFGVGRRLHNLPKLRAIGFAANRRLLEIERLSHDCILGEETLQAINRPVAAGGQRASGPLLPPADLPGGAGDGRAFPVRLQTVVASDHRMASFPAPKVIFCVRGAMAPRTQKITFALSA